MTKDSDTSIFQRTKIRHFHNEGALLDAAYPCAFKDLISVSIARTVRPRIAQWPDYASTPLHSLEALANEVGVESIHYKDESTRFLLKSFKALGGAYATDELLLRELAKRRPREEITRDALYAGLYERECNDIVITSATDGNHGRSVAWGAARRGCPCVIYIHSGVSVGREEALADLGARVVRIDGNYDDSVERAAHDAATNAWHVVSDTSYEGNDAAPRDVMRGYTVMFDEILEQLPGRSPPTHVFIQGGVGGLAAAVIGFFWDVYQSARPRFIIVEPDRADCLFQSAMVGAPFKVQGDLDTIMAGLSCGEVSPLAWPVVEKGADDFLTITDETIPTVMRRLAWGAFGQPLIEAGESAVAGLCAFIAAMAQSSLCDALRLGPESRVLVFGTEGATDAAIYSGIISEID